MDEKRERGRDEKAVDAASTSMTTSTARIQEGSIVMNVPATSNNNGVAAAPGEGSNKKEESAPHARAQAQDVFYNPVQVQNRDLSIVMLSLHWERRFVRSAREQLRKHLRKQQQSPVLSKDEIEQELDRQQKEWEAMLAAGSTPTLSTDDDSTPLPSPVRPYNVLDALAASGLRSLRYWKELGGRVHYVRINDLEQAAVQRAHQNVTDNQLTSDLLAGGSNEEEPLPRGIRIQQGDALDVMYRTRSNKPWSNIDLDPYGSAAPFLDAAVQAIESGGMLSITCTDMAALGGSHPDTCFGRYHALPLQRSGYLQEMALRILLYSIATTAAKYGRSIRPILSVGMDFYVRVFVEVYDSKADVQNLCLRIGHVYQSTRCPSFVIVPSAVMGGKSNRVYQAGRVPATGDPDLFEVGDVTGVKVGGPMWLGPLHDPDVIQAAMDRLQAKPSSGAVPDTALLATRARILGLLSSCIDELNDVPLYYKLPDLCSTIRMSCIPRQAMESALRNAGYRASGYHKEPQALKTDAPNRVIWDILRSWYRQEYEPAIKKKEAEDEAAAASAAKWSLASSKRTKATAPAFLEEPSVEYQILVKPIITPNIDFTVRKDASRGKSSSLTGYARFPMNPEPNWGPKARAKAMGAASTTTTTTSEPNQRKRKKAADVDADAATTEAAAGSAEPS